MAQTGSSDTAVRIQLFVDGGLCDETTFDAVNRRQYLLTREKGITLFGVAESVAGAGGDAKDQKAAKSNAGGNSVLIRSVRIETRALDESDVLNAAVVTASAAVTPPTAATATASTPAPAASNPPSTPVPVTTSVRNRVLAIRKATDESGWTCRNTKCSFVNRIGASQCMKCSGKV